MAKSREYCCCAIPLVNAGIYITLLEQFVLGILVGALSIATPSIVGSATPSFSSWILGIIGFVAAGVQVLGFFGVSRESIGTYRRYVFVHGIVTAAGFSVAATWIIWSAIGHNVAQQRCITNFFNSVPGSNAQEADTLCNIFPWVSIGIMGALWILLAIIQLYLFLILTSYGRNQRRDHNEYDRLKDPSPPLKAESIPLDREPWDSQLIPDGKQKKGYRHLRQGSSISMTDVLNQPFQKPRDSMAATNYDYQPYNLNDEYQPRPTHNRTRTASPNNNYPYNPYIQPAMQSQFPHEASFRQQTPNA